MIPYEYALGDSGTEKFLFNRNTTRVNHLTGSVGGNKQAGQAHLCTFNQRGQMFSLLLSYYFIC